MLSEVRIGSCAASPGALNRNSIEGSSSTCQIRLRTYPVRRKLGEPTAVEDRVVLERRFESTRGPCTPELGVATNRVFPDGTREMFVVPAGKAFVLTDLEGEITEKTGAIWFVGTIGLLNATLTGAVANQHVRARTPLNADAVAAGIATVKLHLASGAVADSGAGVCLSAIVVEKMVSGRRMWAQTCASMDT